MPANATTTDDNKEAQDSTTDILTPIGVPAEEFVTDGVGVNASWGIDPPEIDTTTVYTWYDDDGIYVEIEAGGEQHEAHATVTLDESAALDLAQNIVSTATAAGAHHQ